MKLLLFILLFPFLVYATEKGKNVEEEHPFLQSITKGAASGYLPDTICANCHKGLFESYQEVGMSHSFSNTESALKIEDFTNNTYSHEKSNNHYVMTKKKNDDIIFRRFQIDSDGNKINQLEIKVDWVLGSGNRTRSYLFQIPSGAIYQLPIGWYSQIKQWKMSPGYDNKSHSGIRRQVRRECMFCHNAFPDVPAGSDIKGVQHTFPSMLPHGTGCQRCHGPGEKHVRATLKKDATLDQIHSTIVNPSRLGSEKEMQVCFQCHLLPSVKLVGLRRFDVADYSYTPDMPLDSYMLHVDISVEGEKRSNRFEINHHPYRLMQSKCFTQSEQKPKKMTCLSCHDPHLKPKGKKRLEHFRDACLQCHSKHDRESLNTVLNSKFDKVKIDYLKKQTIKNIDSPDSDTFNPDNCFACHMPQRRTSDVINVTMTDHLITKEMEGKKLLSPLDEAEPIITDVELYQKDKLPKTINTEVYRVITVIRQQPTKNNVRYLSKLLKNTPPKTVAPYSDLATGLLKVGQYKQAQNILEKHLLPIKYPGTEEQLATLYLLLEQPEKAISQLEKLTSLTPIKTTAWYNLSLAYIENKQYEEALKALKETIQLDPFMAKAWYYNGLMHSEQNKKTVAITSLKRALEINPSLSKAYRDLVKLLIEKGDLKEAKRYLLHGKKVSNKPEILNLTSFKKLLTY